MNAALVAMLALSLGAAQKPAKKPAPAPLPRVAAPAAAAPSPQPASEPPAASSPPPSVELPFMAAGSLGPSFAFAGGAALAKLTLRGGREVLRVSEPLSLEVGALLGLQSWGYSGFGLEMSVFAFELLASGRAVYRFSPRLGFYGAAGLGLSHSSSTSSVPFRGYTTTGMTGLALRFAGGLSVELSSRAFFFFEPFIIEAASVPPTTMTFAGQTITTGGGTAAAFAFALGGGARF